MEDSKVETSQNVMILMIQGILLLGTGFNIHCYNLGKILAKILVDDFKAYIFRSRFFGLAKFGNGRSRQISIR
jgi:hypothetical protein